MTEDGFLSIVDRKKEIILVSGFNVFPGEIEDAAMLHAGVAEAGAIAVPDEHAGEVPKLFVVRRDPELTEAAVARPPQGAPHGLQAPALHRVP